MRNLSQARETPLMPGRYASGWPLSSGAGSLVFPTSLRCLGPRLPATSVARTLLTMANQHADQLFKQRKISWPEAEDHLPEALRPVASLCR